MRRNYTSEEYFNFLYDLGFVTDNYISLARCLHGIEYRWRLRMDENRLYDGIEMRKYYLSDENGYLADGFDVYDEDIFGDFVSVFEVFVGLAFKMNRDLGCKLEACEIVCMFCDNLRILYENWEFDEGICEKIIEKWLNGKAGYDIFEGFEGDLDLWSKASIWLDER